MATPAIMAGPARATRVVAGRYELIARIAGGAIGSVYRAFDRHAGAAVAVKLIHERFRSSRREVETFRREARAGELVEHPNVMRVVDSGTDPAVHDFVVMELLTGHTLAKMLADNPTPDIDWSLGVIDQVLAGLAALHAAGVVHRDVKPENIVIDTRSSSDAHEGAIGHAKLCDFGLAKLPRDEGGPSVLDTLAGTLCGTPEYIAPEQAQGRPVGPEADIYACGAVLYQMVTGRLPFTGATPMDIAGQHIGRPVPPPSRFRAGLDLRLERIILKAMAKRPSERFASAEAFRDALRALEDPDSAAVELTTRRRAAWEDDEPTQLFRPLGREDEAVAAEGGPAQAPASKPAPPATHRLLGPLGQRLPPPAPTRQPTAPPLLPFLVGASLLFVFAWLVARALGY